MAPPGALLSRCVGRRNPLNRYPPNIQTAWLTLDYRRYAPVHKCYPRILGKKPLSMV